MYLACNSQCLSVSVHECARVWVNVCTIHTIHARILKDLPYDQNAVMSQTFNLFWILLWLHEQHYFRLLEKNLIKNAFVLLQIMPQNWILQKETFYK